MFSITLLEKRHFPSLSSYQLQIPSWLWVGFYAHFFPSLIASTLNDEPSFQSSLFIFLYQHAKFYTILTVSSKIFLVDSLLPLSLLFLPISLSSSPLPLFLLPVCSASHFNFYGLCDSFVNLIQITIIWKENLTEDSQSLYQ